MTLTERHPGGIGGGPTVDADALAGRVAALDRFVTAAAPHLAPEALATAGGVVESARARLELSRDHTVVALTGATGSGKSSLFNAMAGMQLSPVGVRRPTTSVAYACVWRDAGAAPLLDWLGIDPAHRFVRESALDAEDEAALRGLVLLDLPDFDSIADSHRTEVDRLLRLVDVAVWVTDPQKYADQVIHARYLRSFRRHARNMVVVLNQADRLSSVDVDRCLGDLRALLTADGLSDVPAFATSATAARPGLGELRDTLERAVADRMAALRRLTTDVADATESLTPLVGSAVDADRPDRDATRALTTALAVSAGVPVVTEATARAYRFRAGKSTGWPATRWRRYLRDDPLAQVRLGRRNEARSSAASLAPAGAPSLPPTSASSLPSASASPLPGPAAAERSSAALAIREIGEHAGAGLPRPWSVAVEEAARSRSADLPDALDQAVVGTDLGVDRKPWWWRLCDVLQWLVTVAALAGGVWLLARVGLVALGLPTYDVVRIGPVPLAAVVLVGGALAGILLALLVKPLIAAGARRARVRAAARLHDSITDVSAGYIVEPVRGVLRDYTAARSALADATGRST